MTDALGVDVTPETVRRYAIEHGLHVPASNTDDARVERPADDASLDQSDDNRRGETKRDEDADTADSDHVDSGNVEYEAASDGIGLPDGVTVAAIKEAVIEADTLYEAHQMLGTDRETAKQVLDRLDLLDSVFGRISDEERSIFPDEVEQRIHTLSLNS